MRRAIVGETRDWAQAGVMADIPTMLRGTATLAIERMNEVLQKTEDGEMIVDAFDKVLHRYGYAPKPGAGAPGAVNLQTNNVFFLNKEDYASAKQALVSAHVALPAPAPAEKEVSGEL